ncbi:hypothetical protein HPP92_022124 [Vanilla planifolia]|uniref:U-box domain-containing protein n=1 Tax=Vanilla planifolia TaxID=51239 RepID=A0A835UCX1_VANPL|nr:hypothetical protein HPP92_022124 [Vanilla planifolia]
MALHPQEIHLPRHHAAPPTFDLIPNHTLKRLIYSWRVQNFHCVPSPPSSSSQHHDLLTSLLSSMDSSPFKVSSLKKLRSFTTTNPSLFVSSGGVNALRHIILQSATDPSDHAAFLAGEEALGVLDTLPFDGDEDILGLLSKPDSIKTMLLMLQRGGADARFHAMAILQRVSKARPTIAEQLNLDIDVFKSLLDLLSDDMSTLLSHSSLHFLLEAVAGSQVNRVKAVEAEALRVLIELLPDAGRQRSEKTLLMLKRLCECAEGRSAFADHALGVVAVANKIGRSATWPLSLV